MCAMGFSCAQSPGEIGVASAQSIRSVPSHISTWPGDVYGDSAVGQLLGWAAAPLLDPSHLHLHVPPLQIRATMVAPAPMALAPSSASAWLVSVGPSARRTSMSVPATPARTGPTAPTASTATPAPAPPASAASTARTTPLTAQRGTVLELGHGAEVPVLPHSPGLVWRAFGVGHDQQWLTGVRCLCPQLLLQRWHMRGWHQHLHLCLPARLHGQLL